MPPAVHMEQASTPTCPDHGYGRLDVDPLVRVDARVHEDEAVEMGLLDATQRILDGVVILRAKGQSG